LLQQLRMERRERDELEPVVDELLVDLIGEDDQVWMADHHIWEGFELLRRIRVAGRIAWAVEDQHLGARADGGLKLIGRDLEPVFLLPPDDLDDAAGQLYLLG